MTLTSTETAQPANDQPTNDATTGEGEEAGQGEEGGEGEREQAWTEVPKGKKKKKKQKQKYAPFDVGDGVRERFM